MGGLPDKVTICPPRPGVTTSVPQLVPRRLRLLVRGNVEEEMGAQFYWVPSQFWVRGDPAYSPSSSVGEVAFLTLLAAKTIFMLCKLP